MTLPHHSPSAPHWHASTAAAPLPSAMHRLFCQCTGNTGNTGTQAAPQPQPHTHLQLLQLLDKLRAEHIHTRAELLPNLDELQQHTAPTVPHPSATGLSHNCYPKCGQPALAAPADQCCHSLLLLSMHAQLLLIGYSWCISCLVCWCTHCWAQAHQPLTQPHCSDSSTHRHAA